MREKRLFYNTISSLVFQVTTIICGFILPRLILNAFGSEVNGLVNSITQFLGVISFLERKRPIRGCIEISGCCM